MQTKAGMQTSPTQWTQWGDLEEEVIEVNPITGVVKVKESLVGLEEMGPCLKSDSGWGPSSLELSHAVTTSGEPCVISF